MNTDNTAHSEGSEPKEVIDAMFRAQFGTPENSNFIEAYMKNYFKDWPRYKNAFTHLEWYHIFLEFAEKFETKELQSLRDQLAAKEEEITHWKGGYNAANETIKELSKNNDVLINALAEILPYTHSVHSDLLDKAKKLL